MSETRNSASRNSETRKYVYQLDECTPECADLVGGKALGLGHLSRGGMRVPPGFVVSTAAYRRFLEKSGLAGEIDGIVNSATTLKQRQEASERIEKLFEEAHPDGSIAREIKDSYEQLQVGGDTAPVAVRSSATAEDTTDASFAGQQETYLWIQGLEDVSHHVTRCWASLFTPQAIAYRARLGIPSKEVAMGVVVQTMVPADAAGVMITLDPVTGDSSALSIEAAHGIGHAVVSGEVNPDRYAVDKVTLEVRSKSVVAKQIAYRFDPDTGTVHSMSVPEEQQSAECVTDQEVKELAKLGKDLEKLLGAPQDIEWAIGPGESNPREIFLLQTRPETVWSQEQRGPVSSGGSAMARMGSMFGGKK